MAPTTFLAMLAGFAGGERGGVRELQALRKTVEELKADLAKARQQETTFRSPPRVAERRLVEAEALPSIAEKPPIEKLEAGWIARGAGLTRPQERAWARSIAEEECVIFSEGWATERSRTTDEKVMVSAIGGATSRQGMYLSYDGERTHQPLPQFR
jgi:hypothetical protein